MTAFVSYSSRCREAGTRGAHRGAAPVITGVSAVLGAVVLAVPISACRGPSGGQASTTSSRPAAPSSGQQGPAEQGPYRVTAAIPVGKSPGGVAVDPGTHSVYVATRDTESGNGAVSVIDGSTHAVTGSVQVGKHPRGVAVDPGSHTVYVANSDDATVSVIDGAAKTVTATVPVGKSPQEVAVDPGTHTVYVTNFNDDTVSVIERR